MNLTDLRDELDLRAHEISQPEADVVSGVHEKVRRIRRRRTAAVGTACVAALVSGGLVLANVTGRDQAPPVPAGSTKPVLGSDGMPTRAIPDSPGDIVKDGLRYRAQVADDRLLGGAIGDVGQNRLEFTVPLTSHDLSVAMECIDPNAPDHLDDSDKSLWVSVTVDGKPGASHSCDSAFELRDLQAGGMQFRERDADSTLAPRGSTVTVVVSLTRGDDKLPATSPTARLTGAVYAVGEELAIVDEDGKVVGAVDVVNEHNGFRYRLESIVTAPASHGPLPETRSPNNVPYLVTWGSTGAGDEPAAGATLALDGVDSSSMGGWFGSATEPQPAKPAVPLTMKADGPRPKSGTAFIAIYTLER